MVELHEFLMSKGYNDKCIRLLKSYGFEVQENIGNTYIFTKKEWNKLLLLNNSEWIKGDLPKGDPWI